jgi:hypothetical protein
VFVGAIIGDDGWRDKGRAALPCPSLERRMNWRFRIVNGVELFHSPARKTTDANPRHRILRLGIFCAVDIRHIELSLLANDD